MTEDSKQALIQAEELLDLREIDSAMNILVELLRNSPRQPEVNALIGRAYDLMGDAKQAADFYEAAILFDLDGDGLANVLRRLAGCYAKIGETEKAVLLLRRAKELHPSDADYSDSVDQLLESIMSKSNPKSE